ncbi:hypothetical protein [Halolamina sp. C58]|uniref:hypothetical protein n=1 Tax=Halolamina sp. C58 TaxID=3421640 RepID=UPI003EBFD0B4
MAETERSEAASPDEGDGIGSRRLEAELNTARAEFESLVAESDLEQGDDNWIQRGRELLDDADASLAEGNVEQGWAYLHAATRLSMYGVEAVGGDEALRGEGRALLVEAENAPLSWREEAIRNRIATADGTLRERLTATDLRAAQELLHEGYESLHRKRHYLQTQFRYLRIGASVALLLFLVVAVAGAWSGLLPTPFFEFGTGGSEGSAPANSVYPVVFLIYVVLSGMLGATVFGLRSLRRQPVSTSTPQHLTGFQATVARMVVGAGSALAVFFFVRSEFLVVGSSASLTRGSFLLAIAFVAGYSQRLVHTTVEAVAGMAGSEPSAGQ